MGESLQGAVRQPVICGHCGSCSVSSGCPVCFVVLSVISVLCFLCVPFSTPSVLFVLSVACSVNLPCVCQSASVNVSVT